MTRAVYYDFHGACSCHDVPLFDGHQGFILSHTYNSVQLTQRICVITHDRS